MLDRRLVTNVSAVEPFGTLLQRILIERPIDRRALYWRSATNAQGATARPEVICRAGRLFVAPGTVLSLDTYFNSFFESHWRRHTSG